MTGENTARPEGGEPGARPEGSTGTCSLTVLQAPGRVLTKRYSPGPKGVTKRSYDKAKSFLTQEVEVPDLAGLEAVLRELQGRPDCCVVNAAPAPWNRTGELHLRRVHRTVELVDDRGRFHPIEADHARREWQKGEEAAGRLRLATVLPTLVERPVGILFLDFERTTLPAGIDWRADLAYTAAFLRRRLPPEFHDVGGAYYATASAADLSKPDLGGDEIRMRLCFLLDRPVMPGALKCWVRGTEGLDRSTLNAGQPVYSAAPVFDGGLRDPIPERLGVLAGAGQRVAAPVLADGGRSSTRSRCSSSSTFSGAEGLLPSPRLDRALASLAAQEGAAGSVRSALTQAVFAYVGDVGRDRVDVEALARALAEAASPWRTPEEIAGYGLPALVVWCLSRPGPEDPPSEDPRPAPRPHHANRGMPVAAATKLLKGTVADWLGRSVEWLAARPPEPDLTLPAPPVFGVKGAAGLGKSRELARQLALLPGIEGMNVVIFISDHRLMEEVLAIYRSVLPASVDVKLIKGRGDAKKPEEALCDKIEVTEAVAKAKRSVTAHVCGNVHAAINAHQRSESTGKTSSRKIKACEFAATCRYFQQFRKKAPAVRIMPHSMMFVKHDKLMPEPDLVIIDESFWQNAISTPMLPLDRLTEEGRWKDGPSMSLQEGNKLVDLRMIARHYGAKVEEALLDGVDPRAVVSKDTCLDLARFERGNIDELEIDPRQSLEVQLSITKGWKPNEAALVASFWQGLADEHDLPGRQLQSTQLLRDVGTPGGSPRHMVRTHRRKELRLPKAPVLLLDADLDERIGRRFFPSMKFVDVPVQQSATVIQITDRAGTMRSLVSREEASEADKQSARNRRTELAAFVRRELAGGRPGGGLFVTFKDLLPLLPLLAHGLPDGIDTLHLGHLRGRDGYKNHDAVVVAGRLEPGVFETERQARALFHDDPEPLKLIQPDAKGRVRYESQMRRYRVTPGADGNDAGPAVRVSVHPDGRCQGLLEQVRECEITQAVARLRLVHRTKPAVVYVLSNLPLDLGVTQLTDWSTLVADRGAEACHRWGKIWLLSPSEQSRLAPDLWSTPTAAKEWARRKGVSNPYKILSIGLRHPFPADPPPYSGWPRLPLSSVSVTLVEYRHTGQRGSAHQAYLPGRLTDPEAARAILEPLVGPVGKLELVAVVTLVVDERPAADEHVPPDQSPVDEQPQPDEPALAAGSMEDEAASEPTAESAPEPDDPDPFDVPFPPADPVHRWFVEASYRTSAPGRREHLIVCSGRSMPKTLLDRYHRSDTATAGVPDAA